MPEEFMFVIIIILLSLGFGALAIRWDHNFKLKKEELRALGGDNSLGTSELKGLIQDSMIEVVAPLEERLDLIEKHMRQLPQHTDASKALELPEPVDPREK